ncbi:MAG: DUF61 family protein [Acidilobaceae archaeon]|nr:DUF61 family protein [Acidilobaceae archaeon]
MSEEKAREYLARALKEEARRLAALLPAESITLMELSRGRRELRLNSGDLHRLREEEVERLLQLVPVYLWLNVRVPLLLRYRREEDGSSRYLVEGDIWQRRLAALMLGLGLSAEGAAELSVAQFGELVAKFGSLVFVSIEARWEEGEI